MPSGRLIDIVPRTPDIVGRDLSFRDWNKGVTATGRLKQVLLDRASNAVEYNHHGGTIRVALGAEETEVQGTGMGPALSKGLMEAMGGALTAESVEGPGTTFTVELAQAAEVPGPAR